MKALKYSDICLIPEFGQVASRSECDPSVEVKGVKYKLPIIPANMKAVVAQRQCEWLSQNHFLYSMHRFDVDIGHFIDVANRDGWRTVSISVGVKAADKEVISNIRTTGAKVDIITIDIAHGYSQAMQDMLAFVRQKLGDDVCVIAGNVCTPDAVISLYNWGADYVKVGIGQGSPCTTKDKTGFTMPMFTCVRKCGECYASRMEFSQGLRVPIIADGGVQCNGDVAKALVAGADLVMAGGLFAACSDSPAISMEHNGAIHKAYFGSASFENKKTNSHIEGTLKKIASNGVSLKKKMIEITENLQSAISYGGGKDLSCLRKVKHMQL
tara:strand:- start:24386 stop:25363 length:978 start_codon:yes stop_codon:yes gene_type:complete